MNDMAIAARERERRSARRWALLATALLINALCTLALSYAAQYHMLARAVGGAGDVSYNVLIRGKAMSQSALEWLSGTLPEGVELMRGANGAVYGYARSNSAWGCASGELRLRSVLGAAARAHRWISAQVATRVQGGALPTGGSWSVEPAARAAGLISACGGRAKATYVGNGCASARGAGYHAAVRVGEAVEYMLADGYLPVDY